MAAFKVLLVHYDPRTLERFKTLLEEHEFEVAVARDGGSAVAALHEHEPDLVLLESMLPKVHGFEVCQDLKKTRLGKKTPVVLMTSVYKGRKYRHEAIHEHGANEYLELPMEDAKLVDLLRRTIDAAAGAAPDAEAGA